jgi:hypothetical protein
MCRWLAWWHIVESACGNNHSLAVTRSVRHRAVAFTANLPREAFRFREIETPE